MTSFRFKTLLPLLVLLTTLTLAAAPALTQTANAAAQSNKTSDISYEALANILDNPEAREKLIKQLRAMDTTKAKEAVEPVKDTKQSVEPGFAHQLAQATQSFAGNITDQIRAVVALFDGKSEIEAKSTFDTKVFFHASVQLLTIILVTVLAYLLLRAAAGPLFARSNQWGASRHAGLAIVWRRLLAVSFAFALDLVTIAVAAAIGYSLAVFLFGDAGTIGVRESLFINAFVMIESFKAVIRLVFASRYEGLRLFAMSTEVATWWGVRLRWLAGLIGYAMLVAVPILNTEISHHAGGLVGLVIMALAYIYALRIIISNRKAVGARLDEQAAQASSVIFGVLTRVLARTWHWLAGFYCTALLMVSQIAPEQALPYMAKATLVSGIAIAIGLLLSGTLTKVLDRPLHLSQRFGTRMPALENRLNTYVPPVLRTVRVVLLLAVSVIAIDAWEIFSLGAWLTSGAGQIVLTVLVQIAIVLAISLAFWTVCASIIEARMEAPNASPRTITLMTLFRNALAVVVGTLTFMIVLSQVGVDIGPLLAGAGVLGLAVGFGAQKLVQDVITGVFIQIENAFNTGDWITVGGISGGVERLSIRSVSLRDLEGTYHVIPFSAVGTVSNYMRDFGYHVGEYRISLREDIDEAISHLRAAFEDLKADENTGPYVLEDLTIPGVTALADSSVNIRAMIKSTPGMQWAVGRAYNRLVKIHFDAAGIEIPYPHRTMFFGANKHGDAQPAPIRMLASSERPDLSGSHPDRRGAPAPDTDFTQRDIEPEEYNPE